MKGSFSQVLVAGEDTLQFSWSKKHELDGPLIEYQMRSHVFGATSSPCTMYAFWKVASDNEANKDVDAVATMRNNIYVNDL